MSERVVLIDGSGMIFRAFYAIPSNFTTKDGKPTNATYGMALMFRKLFEGKTPAFGAVVFDAPGGSFRSERYSEYKAQREAMPDELKAQLEDIDRLVEAYSFKTIRLPGFEADDVIGTLTQRALDAGHEVVIASVDKDFAQLINDRVRMRDTVREVTYDAETARKKWGVPPHQVIDMLAVCGDKVDNIPGIPGVGIKTISKLLDEYGDLDGIYANLDALTKGQRKKFEEHKEAAYLSRELATIVLDAPVEEQIEQLALTEPTPEALDELYMELEFFSLLEGERPAAETPDVERLEPAALAEWFDAETPTALFPVVDGSPARGTWVGLALARPGRVGYLAIAGEGGHGEAAIEALAGPLADGEVALGVEHRKDLYCLCRRHGITLAGTTFDSRLCGFLADPAKTIPHDLGKLSKEYLQHTLPPAKDLLGGGRSQITFAEVEPEALAAWAGAQAEAVQALREPLEARLAELGLADHLRDHELPLAEVLARMELVGIGVDGEELTRVGEEFAERLAGYEREIFELAGREFNINSTKQLSAVLFDELELPVIKKTKTGYSTNVEVLERLAAKGHRIAEVLVDYRKLGKLISTYTNVLSAAVDPETGRVHSTFQMTVGVTGRLITTDPDLQRTPVRSAEGKRIREAFVARPGHRLVVADWSQIELRILAHVSQDPALLEAFAAGTDLHRLTASKLFDCEPEAVTSAQRDVGKTVNFATIYGQGATALGQQLGVSRNEAKRYIERYFALYAGVRAWLDATIAEAKAEGKGYVTTLLGRRRFIPELFSNTRMDQTAGERIAANTPIQGSGADICKLAMLRIDRELRERELKTAMVLQVHDELLFEAPDDEVEEVVALVEAAMREAWPELSVPLVVEAGVGGSWAEAK